jgi:hypothetical protein
MGTSTEAVVHIVGPTEEDEVIEAIMDTISITINSSIVVRGKNDLRSIPHEMETIK